MLVIFRNIFTPHARIFRKFIINVPHVHNIASQTMGKIYFETFQSLWLMKIVMKLCTLPPRNIFFQKKRPPTDHRAKSIILPSNPGPHCGLMGHEGFIRQTQTLIASRRLKLGQGLETNKSCGSYKVALIFDHSTSVAAVWKCGIKFFGPY
jgi:hypothetical protein